MGQTEFETGNLFIAIHHADISSAVEGAVGGVGFGEGSFYFEVGKEDQGEDDDDDRQRDKDNEPEDDQGEQDQDREDLGDWATGFELDGSAGGGCRGKLWIGLVHGNW